MLNNILWTIEIVSITMLVASLLVHFLSEWFFGKENLFVFIHILLVVAVVNSLVMMVSPVTETVEEVKVEYSAVEPNENFKAIIVDGGNSHHIFYKRSFIVSDDFTSYKTEKRNAFGMLLQRLYWFQMNEKESDH